MSSTSAHALVPAKVAPIRSDITAAIANSYATNASAGVEALKTQYHATQVMLAVASTGGGGSDVLTLRLAGADAMGLFSLQRKVTAQDAGDEPLMRAAARLAFDTVQERWKLTRDSFVQGEPAAGTEMGTAAAAGAGYMTGELSSVQITAQFSGLKEWQAIRTRLQHLPGVQNWDLTVRYDPRSATISFDFPGGAGRLTAMAGAQGLAV